ncbi:MAG TPA: histidine kinase, partial [Crinalium sp.]
AEIAQAEAEVQQLQSRIDTQERDLQDQIDSTLSDLETTQGSTANGLNEAIANAVITVRDSEEVSLLRRRYAQLQAQLAILKANMTARYGERYDDVKQYLDDAKNWYQEAQQRAAEHADDGPSLVEQKQADIERKMNEAGTALARKERQVRQLLKELLHSIMDSK